MVYVTSLGLNEYTNTLLHIVHKFSSQVNRNFVPFLQKFCVPSPHSFTFIKKDRFVYQWPQIFYCRLDYGLKKAGNRNALDNGISFWFSKKNVFVFTFLGRNMIRISPLSNLNVTNCSSTELIVIINTIKFVGIYNK